MPCTRSDEWLLPEDSRRFLVAHRFIAIDSPKITRLTSECFVQAEGPHTWHRVPCVVTSPIHHPRHLMIVSHLRHNPRMVLYTTEIIRACRPENRSTAFRVVTVFETNLSGEALHFVSDSYKAQSSIHRSQNEVTKGTSRLELSAVQTIYP